MYNPDKIPNEVPGFRPLKEKPKVDSTTLSIYHSKKQVLGLISGRMDILKPAQRKHFEQAKEFVEGFEAGIIWYWRDYYR